MEDIARRNVSKQEFVRCNHPDHNEQTDCQDRAIGCSKHCVCCMGNLAVLVNMVVDNE